MVDDAEARQALGGLGGDHRRAVVGQERARQAALLDGLAEPVDQRVGGRVEVPLQVAAQPRAIVDHAEQLWVLPRAGGRQHLARALVEVEVPQRVDVADLEAARLAGLARRVAVGLELALLAMA
jgi:hypothetical protein